MSIHILVLSDISSVVPSEIQLWLAETAASWITVFYKDIRCQANLDVLYSQTKSRLIVVVIFFISNEI